ncbi:hypothetical protein ZOSMA_263G00010, partial [Zostera marina]
MSPITPPRTRYSERNDHISRVLTEKFTLVSQKLIAMGFSAEELMALFENNWRLDNSIHWLLHRRRTMEITHSSNIDISNDSKAIKELSRRFNCTMLDVERIVISYDGDLEKTANFLMLNQQQHMRYEILSPTECLHQFRTRDLSNDQNPFQRSTFDMPRERCLYQSNDRSQFDHPSFDMTRETSLHQQFDRPSTDINIQIQEEASRNARYTMQHPKSTTNLVNELSPTDGEWNPFKPSFFDTVRENWLKYLSNHQNPTNLVNELSPTNGEWNPFKPSFFDTVRENWLKYLSNNQNQFQHSTFDMPRETSLHQPNDRNQFDRPSTDINIQIQEEASRNAKCTIQYPKSTTNLVNELSPT